ELGRGGHLLPRRAGRHHRNRLGGHERGAAPAAGAVAELAAAAVPPAPQRVVGLDRAGEAEGGRDLLPRAADARGREGARDARAQAELAEGVRPPAEERRVGAHRAAVVAVDADLHVVGVAGPAVAGEPGVAGARVVSRAVGAGGVGGAVGRPGRALVDVGARLAVAGPAGAADALVAARDVAAVGVDVAGRSARGALVDVGADAADPMVARIARRRHRPVLPAL